MRSASRVRRVLVVSTLMIGALIAGGAGALLAACGPFTDVSDVTFCPFVLEVFYVGITTGTTPTPGRRSSAFLSRTVDSVLKRGGRRAAMKQFATPQVGDFLGLTTLSGPPLYVECDGADVWVRDPALSGEVSRIRASDGKLLETWTGAEVPVNI